MVHLYRLNRWHTRFGQCFCSILTFSSFSCDLKASKRNKPFNKQKLAMKLFASITTVICKYYNYIYDSFLKNSKTSQTLPKKK